MRLGGAALVGEEPGQVDRDAQLEPPGPLAERDVQPAAEAALGGRRGVRRLLGAEQSASDQLGLGGVKNMVLYGTPTAGSTTLVNNLQPSNITVCYSGDYGVGQGTVSVKIEGYSYTFAVGGFTISMPAYQTTVVGESAGTVPGITCP